jgi:hypothetical protein
MKRSEEEEKYKHKKNATLSNTYFKTQTSQTALYRLARKLIQNK